MDWCDGEVIRSRLLRANEIIKRRTVAQLYSELPELSVGRFAFHPTHDVEDAQGRHARGHSGIGA